MQRAHAGHPGIIEENVDPSKTLLYRAGYAFHIMRAGIVRGEKQAFRAEFVGYSLAGFGLPIDNRHACAFCGKKHGRSFPDAGAGTGYDCHLILQTHFVLLEILIFS
jgi:hypothetical protein